MALSSGLMNEYSNIINNWKLGDWVFLEKVDASLFLDQECYEEVVAMKAIAHFQNGKFIQARNIIKDISSNVFLLEMIASGVCSSLARSRLLLNQNNEAFELFKKSLEMKSDSYSIESDVIRRIENQLQWCPLKIECDTPSLNSRERFFGPSFSFDASYTISFWLKIDEWPDTWCDLVSKKKDDVLNEFCFRVKNKSVAQIYYGDGLSSVVLHTFDPTKHIELNQWVFLAVVNDKDCWSRLYINGVIVSERDIASLPSPLCIDQKVALLGKNKKRVQLEAEICNFEVEDSFSSSQKVREKIKSFNQGREIECKNIVDFLNIKKNSLSFFKSSENIKSLDYHELLDSISSEELVVVVIGANDGKLNDPVFSYLYNAERANRVVLVEPQRQIIPYLEKNYSFHDKKHIVNAAVGKPGVITLHAVSEQYWELLDVPYAQDRNWPIYRAPTGVTSASKEHVENWLKKHMPSDNIEESIESFDVVSMSLADLLKKEGLSLSIDVLQIDTEGADDSVIYHSNLEILNPKLIMFEAAHLKGKNLFDLYIFLHKLGYFVYRNSEDAFALHESLFD